MARALGRVRIAALRSSGEAVGRLRVCAAPSDEHEATVEGHARLEGSSKETSISRGESVVDASSEKRSTKPSIAAERAV